MVYALHMRLEALSKTIMFYDMDDVFNIIPSETLKQLEEKLKELFVCQAAVSEATDLLATNPNNSVFRTDLGTAVAAGVSALYKLEAVPLAPISPLKNFKGIGDEEVRVLNQ